MQKHMYSYKQHKQSAAAHGFKPLSLMQFLRTTLRAILP
jgi:hypothetical protein